MGPRNMSTQAAVALTLGVVIVAGCAEHRVPENQRLQAQGTYEVATRQIEERQFALAFMTLQKVNTLDPNVAMYHNALGIVCLQLGRADVAQTEFKRATELERDYAEAHLNLGIALAEQQRWAEAVKAYERAIALPRLVTPDTAYQNLGLALYHLHRYPEAEQALRFAISLDPRMAPAYYHLGLVLTAANRRDEARHAFERARELAPGSPFGEAAGERLKALGQGG